MRKEFMLSDEDCDKLYIRPKGGEKDVTVFEVRSESGIVYIEPSELEKLIAYLNQRLVEVRKTYRLDSSHGNNHWIKSFNNGRVYLEGIPKSDVLRVLEVLNEE